MVQMRILLNPFDAAEQLGLTNGDWILGILEVRVFWPKKKQIVYYAGREFILLPAESNNDSPIHLLPAIGIKSDSYGLSHEEARKEIMQFASALSWREGSKVEIIMWSGGNLPRSIGIMHNNQITDYFEEDHLPIPNDSSAKAALAFYREGVSIDNPFYSFLSFYKAFSVAIEDKKRRGNWMNEKRSELDNKQALDRLVELDALGYKVGDYLYKQCRQQIAHADQEPFVNPDDTDDHFRLQQDIPLIRNFAELAIEEKFDIKRISTIYDEHLYELEGFRKILSSDIIENLKKGNSFSESTEIEFPDKYLIVAKRGHERFPLEEMILCGGEGQKGGLILFFKSITEAVELIIFLDFMNEKLGFDPIQGFRVQKDRSNQQRVKEELSALRFQKGILSNGHLEIWDLTTKIRLGCSEPYLPFNCRVDFKQFESEIKILQRILAEDKISINTSKDA